MAALRAHLKPATALGPVAARRLGLAACRLGLGTLALARIHDAALAAPAPPGKAGTPSRRSPTARAESFFNDVMAATAVARLPGAGPSVEGRLIRETGRRRVAQKALATNRAEHRALIEKSAVERASADMWLTQETGRRRVAQAALATSLSENQALLEEGSVERASAEGRLTQETGRRKVVQEALTASEGEHVLLLKRSDSLEEELRQLSRSLLKAHEDERMRISRELHDTLGQTLAAVNVGLASLKSAALVDPRAFRGSVARTQRLVQKSMRTVHRFARSLRPTLLDDLGLAPALHAFAREFGKRNGLRIRVTAPVESARLDGDRRTALFRVAQEALVNVGRHAGARNVRVSLGRTASGVRLEVWNDGTPFDVERALLSRTNRHLGLLCMRERMEMVGGTFSVRSSRKAGTTVRADVPLPEQAA